MAFAPGHKRVADAMNRADDSAVRGELQWFVAIGQRVPARFRKQIHVAPQDATLRQSGSLQFCLRRAFGERSTKYSYATSATPEG